METKNIIVTKISPKFLILLPVDSNFASNGDKLSAKPSS